MGIYKRVNAADQPPLELEEWHLFAINRGWFTRHRSVCPECGRLTETGYFECKRKEWIAARHAWAAEHFWPGGIDEMFEGEIPVTDEAFDSEFET